jgi:phenylalanyl-tRNA synthetase beta chain
MKLSLAWAFDHIHGDLTAIDIPYLIKLLSIKTAEIELYKKIRIEPEQFSLGLVEKIQTESISVHDIEHNKSYKLPLRNDLQKGDHAILKYAGNTISWAKTTDFHSEKDSLLPAVHATEALYKSWKQDLEIEDYILDISNTAISHRSDLWSHRGYAREIAALLELPLKPLDQFLATKVIKNAPHEAAPTVESPYTTRIESPDACKRFASLYFDYLEQSPSRIAIAQRLARIDARPIDSIVDLTNYVMFDIGQPLHAYDTEKLSSRTIAMRTARAKETITLLDNQHIELTTTDLLVTDGDKPIALAGIMGGSKSSIGRETKSVFLESACFAPGTIRKTTTRLALRTDASVRFEKSIDPNLNTIGILRFLHLVHENNMNMRTADIINSLGERAREQDITVTHHFIEQRLGIPVAPDFVRSVLERLAFKVNHDAYAKELTYIITVPTFRGTKDITIKEDIVEEVGRFFGYDNIPLQLPQRSMDYFNLNPVLRLRTIKQLLAHSMHMQEVYNYSLFDEAFIKTIDYVPQEAVTIKNPVSENWQRMVTSLIPGLLKAIDINKTEYDQLRFFEWARTWQLQENIVEHKSLAGIFFEQKQAIDFYQIKSLLAELFNVLELPVTWEKVSNPTEPWYAPYQTAYIMYQGTKIGIAGKAHIPFLSQVAPGDAFMIELDGDFLISYQPKTDIFETGSKYPSITRDISIFVPAQYTAEEISKTIAQTNPLIVSVSLIDYFIKDDLPDKRSLTFRCIVQDATKTLTNQETEIIWQNVVQSLEKLGATIR